MDKHIPVVGIGASAGGLGAFANLLKDLPSNTGMAFVLIQHLDPGHKTNLPSLLSRHTDMPVKAITADMPVKPDHVYVLTPGREVIISGGRLQAADRPKEGLHRPIDIFFDSLASDLGSRAMAVVLTGTAADGAEGLRRVKEESGITFAQDPADAQYPDMPRAAIATTDVDFILPPARIAKELARICCHPYILGDEEKAIALERGALGLVFRRLKTVSGIDFSDYKQSTVARRTARRMALRQIDSLADYAELLKKHPDEADALARDLLINVTGFFREEAAFRTLKDTVFPALFAGLEADSSLPPRNIRIWTPGCATGEEPYTVGICLLEYLEEFGDGLKSAPAPSVTIFATDVNESLIETARAGIYPESALTGLSGERLARFFVKTKDGWRVIERLRDLCVFARQNLAADPPFSRLDLITCRNLLIYLGSPLQRQVLQIFQYALNPGGWLLLGGSESVGESAELFEAVDKKHKLYRKKPGQGNARLTGAALLPGDATGGTGDPRGEKAAADLFDPEKEADRIILRKYPPAGFLVDESMRIIQFRGNAGPYLQPSPGKASLNLVTMARTGMAKALRAAANEAKKTGLPAAKGPVRIDIDGDLRDIDIEMDPIKAPGAKFFFLISCIDVTGRPGGEEPLARAGRPSRAKDKETVELRQELAAVKEHLQAVIEEKEASNEELTAANEEIRASNEEIQSVNEELQTATEELQAANEELSSVNEELLRSVENERGARSEIDAVFSSLTDAVVVYGHDGRVVRANPAAHKTFGLDPIGLDLAAVFSNFKPRRPDGSSMTVKEMPSARALNGERVIDETFTLTNAKGQEMTVLSSAAPLFTLDKVSGAVVTWHDVTERERLVREIERSEALYRAIGEANPYGVWIADPDGGIVYLSQSFLNLVGKTLDQCREFGWTDRLTPKDAKRTVADWKRAVRKEDCWDYEYRILGADGKHRTILSRGVAVRDDRGETTSWVGIHLDITEHKEAERLAETLNEINNLLGSTLDFNEMMRRLAVDGAKALGADACRIALLEDDHWVLRFTSGLPTEAEGRAFKRREMPAANLAVETGKPVAVDNIHKDPRVNPKVMEEYGVRSLLATSLVVRGESLGVIFFDFREPVEFRKTHVDFAAKLGAAVSLALENVRLYEAQVEAQKQSKEELAVSNLLLETADTLAVSLDLQQVLEVLADGVLQATKRKRIFIAMIDEKAAEVTFKVSRGRPGLSVGTRTRLSEALLVPRQALRDKKTRLLDYEAPGASKADKEWAKKFNARLALFVPLIAEDRVIGFINTDDSGERRGFSPREIDLVEAIAAQATVAIERARLYETERESRRLSEALARIDAAIASTLDFDRISQSAVEETREALGYGVAGIILREGDQWVLRYVSSESQQAAGTRFNDNQAPLEMLVEETNNSILVNDTQADERLDPEVMRRYPVSSYAGAPLRARDRLIGVFGLTEKRTAAFTTQQVDFISKVAASVSLCLENARLFEAEVKAQKQANEELEMSHTLRLAAETLAGEIDEYRVLKKLAELTAGSTGRGRVSVSLTDNATREVTVAAVVGPSVVDEETKYGYELIVDSLKRAVIDEKRTFILDYDGPDVTDEERRRFEPYGAKLNLIVPIVVGGETVANIAVDEPGDKTPFSGRDTRMVEGIADQAAVAIERARLYETERESRRLNETLNLLNATVATTMNVDEIMREVAAEGAKALDCDATGILMSEGDQWVLRYLYGLPSNLIGSRIDGNQMPHVIEATKTGQPVIIYDVRGAGVSRRLIEAFKLGAVIAVPLFIRDKPIGVIGFNYAHPRRFSEAQRDFTRKLAALTALAMENIRLYEAQHEIAETLQEALLTMPASLPGVAFGHLYESATEAARVGGDFYDLFELEHGRVGIVIGDVAGKGLGAAAMTTLVKGAIKAYAFEGMFPAGVIAKTNSVIIKTTPERTFVTAFFGILDKTDGQLTYCSAGHPPAYIIKTDGTVKELESGSPVVGIFPDMTYQDKSLILKRDERLVLYTDGITEARRGAKFFGEERLRLSIKKNAKTPVDKLPLAIFRDVSDYNGGVFSDDVALLAVELKSGQAD